MCMDTPACFRLPDLRRAITSATLIFSSKDMALSEVGSAFKGKYCS